MRSADANGSRAAVRVEQPHPGHNARPGNGKPVQHLGLRGVCLVEARGPNLKRAAQQPVVHDAWTVQRDALPAENRVGPALVDVLDNACDLRLVATYVVHELLGTRKPWAIGNHCEQALLSGVAHAHHGMAQHAAPAVLLVGGDAAALGRARHGVEHVSRTRGFYQARRAGHNAMRAGGIEATAHAPARARRKRRGRLVPVAAWLIHAADLLERAVIPARGLAQDLLDQRLLALKLDGVGYREPLAATAGLCDGAGVGAISHGSPVNEGSWCKA